MTEKRRVMVFDFDGTISLGDGPVRSYARHIAAGLDRGSRDAFLAKVDAGLGGELPLDGATFDSEPVDGYDLVRLLSLRFDVTDDARSTAYLRSREELASDTAPVSAPDGIVQFLAKARPNATLVLATNAPNIRIPETLEFLGLAAAFDAVHTSVGKPTGLEAIIDDLLAGAAHRSATDLLSVGDVWVNDLEPAHRRGGGTALVGPRLDLAAMPTLRAETLPELYPRLTAWLSGSTFPSAPSAHQHTAPPPSLHAHSKQR